MDDVRGVMGHVFVGGIFVCRIGQEVNKVQCHEGMEIGKNHVWPRESGSRLIRRLRKVAGKPCGK